MKAPRALHQFCNSLDGLHGTIAGMHRGLGEHLLAIGYPRHYREIEEVRALLENVGLYEFVRESIVRSEQLVRAGRFREAELLVLDANVKVSEASGVTEDLRGLYGKKA